MNTPFAIDCNGLSYVSPAPLPFDAAVIIPYRLTVILLFVYELLFTNISFKLTVAVSPVTLADNVVDVTSVIPEPPQVEKIY